MPGRKDMPSGGRSSAQSCRSLRAALVVLTYWRLGGTRKKWEERGVKFELSWNNFFQGVGSGGLETGFAYGGKLTGELTLDTTGALTRLTWWSSR